MSKSFLTHEQLLNHLEEEKNLIISNREYATNMLKQIGYFSLIGGYKSSFKNSTTKKYIKGTNFEDIVALYKLDENLRELFLKYLLQIECHIRSLVSYYFSEKYGENQASYLTVSNYNNIPRNNTDITKLIDKLSELANYNTDYPYIVHHRNSYGNVPLWVLFNGITFGTLSKFYSLMTSDLKVKVSKNFARVNEKQLEQYLSVITKFRNVCAHNERLFSYQTRNDIPNTPLHKSLGIPQKGTQYISGKRDLFSVVIAFRYLLSNEDFKKFKQSLSKILDHYFASSNAISECSLYEQMGFPANWKSINAYKK